MKTKKTFSIIGMILGAGIIAFAIFMFASGDVANHYSYIRSYTFGADFYTEQYNATREAASAAQYINSNIKTIFDFSCFLLMGFGALIVCYFGVKLGECAQKIEHKVIVESDKTE